MTTAQRGGTRSKSKIHRNGHNGAPESIIALPHGRVPPHNLDAERSMLGGVLFDRESRVRDLAEICGAADFYRDGHRKIWEAMLALQEDGEPVDRVSVVERLRERGDLEAAGGEEYLGQLDACPPTSANLAYYAKIVHDKARARRLIEAGTQIAQLGYEQHGDVADYFAEAERRVKLVIDGAPKGNRFIAAYQRFSADELAADPDPPEFILYPYIPAEEVSNLAAPGGSNKTTLLTLMAVARALGRRMFKDIVPREGETVILTTEDRKKHYQRRMAALREHLGSEWNPRAVAERIHLIDMYGMPVRLIAADRGEQYVPTQDVEDLADCLHKKAPRADHLIIETISRVTGGVENNPSMTVLVNACERLCMLAKVAVTLVGHVGQNTARSGVADAYSSRGGSALGDNGRASMVLQPLNEKNKKLYAATLEISDEDMKHTLVWALPKANNVRPVEPRFLRRLSSRFGPLLVDADLAQTGAPPEDPDEPRARRLKKGESRTWPQLKRDIVAFVDEARRAVTFNEVDDGLGGKRLRTQNAVKELLKSGHLANNPAGDLIPGTTTEPLPGTTGPAQAGSRSQFPYGTAVGGTGESERPASRLARGLFSTGEPGGTGNQGNHPTEEPPQPTDKDIR